MEIEDANYGDGSKDKMYEQILKNSLEKYEKNQRDNVLKWCEEYLWLKKVVC